MCPHARSSNQAIKKQQTTQFIKWANKWTYKHRIWALTITIITFSGLGKGECAGINDCFLYFVYCESGKPLIHLVLIWVETIWASIRLWIFYCLLKIIFTSLNHFYPFSSRSGDPFFLETVPHLLWI